MVFDEILYDKKHHEGPAGQAAFDRTQTAMPAGEIRQPCTESAQRSRCACRRAGARAYHGSA